MSREAMTGISDNGENVAKDDLPQEEHDEGALARAEAARVPELTPIVEIPPRSIKPLINGEIKCKACKNNKGGQPEINLEQQASGLLEIKFNGHCGCPFRITLNRNFEMVEHSCVSFKPLDQGADSFDFDAFLESDKEIDDIIAEKPAKPAKKLVLIEDLMKMAVKNLARPLVLLIPTTAQKKTEAQLRAEREHRMKELIGTEVNLVYLRVLEFEKHAASNNAYQIDKFCKGLKNLDKGAIIGFIKKVNNDFLIVYDEQAQTVRFFNPSKPELEILSREFEKWLRFNRL